jgi:hypothetical protein
MAQDGIKQTWSTALTAVATAAQGPQEELGAHRHQGGKWYKYVQYVSSAPIACVAGTMVGYYGLDGYKLHKVTLDTSDQIMATVLLAAGVTQAIIPELGYGWIQIKGFATMSVALIGSPADGAPLTLVGATADTGDLDLYITTVALSHLCAWAGDVSDKEICVDCPW